MRILRLLFAIPLLVGFLPLSSQGCQSSTTVAEPVRLIRLEVQLSGGSAIKGLVEEGEFLRVEDATKKKSLAFKPDVKATPARVQVFEIQKGSDGAETQRFLDETTIEEIGPGSTARKVATDYSVRILEVIRPV